MAEKNWFEFKASVAAPESDLYLYDEVGGWGTSASEFIDALSTRREQRINLHIHSPGGSVFEGHAIFNALRNHPAGVTTHIDGIAASMASAIAMAGSPVKIASNGFLMIHNPWSQAAGGADEMRKQADVLDKLKDSLVKIYAGKSGMSEAEISAAMDAETWYNAAEAVEFGLADEVFEGMQAAATLDLSKISAKVPEGALQFAKHPDQSAWEEPVIPDLQSMLTNQTEDLAVAQARVAILSGELNDAQASLIAQRAECDAIKAELEAERAKSASIAEQINAKAAAMIAQTGHAPVAISAYADDKVQPSTSSNILAQFEQLRQKGTSSEWMTFFKAHRSEIIAAAKTNAVTH